MATSVVVGSMLCAVASGIHETILPQVVALFDSHGAITNYPRGQSCLKATSSIASPMPLLSLIHI